MTTKRLGFVGLGNMGNPIASNIVAAGFDLMVFDIAGTQERAPENSKIAHSLSDLVEHCDTLFFCLPDGHISNGVAKQIAAFNNRVVTCVIDFSTVGTAASQQAFQTLSEAEIAYIDSPVSGGKSGAVAGTITVIWGGPVALMEAHRPILEALGGNLIHVGDRAGQGQSMKLLNNFLSGMAMAATSEAIHYGLAQGLEMETMLEVLNVSSGKNTATSDKFPNQVATGKFAAGFHTALMKKDISLYLEGVQVAQTPKELGELLAKIWNQADEAMPGSDFSKIFEFVRDQK